MPNGHSEHGLSNNCSGYMGIMHRIGVKDNCLTIGACGPSVRVEA